MWWYSMKYDWLTLYIWDFLHKMILNKNVTNWLYTFVIIDDVE